ncbi:MAG: hypothetical protein LBD38_03395 [Streptococcaceae bacterium]|jgi:adenosylhomocysteine nucleosidase|nr:hypothetical protein [Streptococcaceae bacterium]
MKIGVICSIKYEAELLLEELENVVQENVEGQTFYIGQLKNKQIVFGYPSEREIRTVENITEVMVERYQISHLIALGFAGSVNDLTAPLNIVIANSVFSDDVPTPILSDEKLVQIFDKVYPSNVVGKIFTSAYFIDNIEAKQKISDKGAIAVDLGTISVAIIAKKYNLPFVSVSAITDNSNDTALKIYKRNEFLAAEKIVDVLISGLKSRYY